MNKKIYLNSFYSASLAVFAPLFIWGNTLSHIPWIFQKLEMNNSTLGYLFMIFSVVQLVFSQLAGRVIVPNLGSRFSLVIGLIVFSCTPIFFVFSNSINLFLFAAVPAGIGFGIINTTATAVTSVAENKTNKILQTYYSAFFSMGILLGGLCSGLYRYLEFNSYILFFILILFGLISTLFVFNLGLKKQYDETEKMEKFKIPENKLLIYSFYLFLFFASVTAIVDWAPLWFEKELLTTSLIASLTIVCWFSGETISKFFGAILIEKFNEKIIGSYLPLSGAIIYIIIVLFGNSYLILIGLFILGFTTANFVPIIIRLALKSTNENVNTASANLITLGFLGFLLGPAIIGYTSEIYSIHFNVIAISFLWVLIFSTFLFIIRKFTDL
tara:strand:+ start:168 stop:1322 length:1155 start_codon:yes stop_codon:yes gene_type:complete